MHEDQGPINVAIACQGGGAQTAFTAGALSALLRRYRKAGSDCEFRIVALSGTSGGAVSAALAWRDLVLDRPDAAETPTVETFWKKPYPDGNAAWPLPDCFLRDWLDFLGGGTLPWLRSVDHLRNSAVQSGTKAMEAAFAATPIHVEAALRPYFFARLFDLIDATPAGAAGHEISELYRWQLDRLAELPLPGARQLANFFGDLLDLQPWHAESVIRQGEPALLRRECDVQDALLAVLQKYFDEACLEEIRQRIAAPENGSEPVPALLIGAADALQVRDARDERPRPVGAGDAAIEKAKAKGKALEEHDRHRASFSNVRVFRASEKLDELVRCIVASTAIPTLMRAVQLDGTALWDGLYSTNPPIYDLPDVHGALGCPQNDPDEIWVIRINPTEVTGLPDTAATIADRQNELAGNLPLTQEIRNVIQIGGAWKGDRYYKPITFGFIDMSEEVAARLPRRTKWNKDRRQIDILFADGERQMNRFYDRWLEVTEQQEKDASAFVYREDYSYELRVREIDLTDAV